MTGAKHSAVRADKTGIPARYSYKNWSREYRCPECGRQGWFNENFLGERVVVCDGHRFHRIKPTFGGCRAAGLSIRELMDSELDRKSCTSHVKP